MQTKKLNDKLTLSVIRRLNKVETFSKGCLFLLFEKKVRKSLCGVPSVTSWKENMLDIKSLLFSLCVSVVSYYIYQTYTHTVYARARVCVYECYVFIFILLLLLLGDVLF